jgi:hypothetical protein
VTESLVNAGFPTHGNGIFANNESKLKRETNVLSEATLTNSFGCLFQFFLSGVTDRQKIANASLVMIVS